MVTPNLFQEVSENGTLQSPVARREPVEHLLHGHRRTDDYALLTQLGICE
jgi:hypothetical protein